MLVPGSIPKIVLLEVNSFLIKYNRKKIELKYRTTKQMDQCPYFNLFSLPATDEIGVLA